MAREPDKCRKSSCLCFESSSDIDSAKARKPRSKSCSFLFVREAPSKALLPRPDRAGSLLLEYFPLKAWAGWVHCQPTQRSRCAQGELELRQPRPTWNLQPSSSKMFSKSLTRKPWEPSRTNLKL